MTIRNVSDTARWVAYYRAMETRRSDAIFRDPYAERLAGPEGRAIVEGMRGGRQAAWAMIVRTAVLDEIILRKVREGADVVLNLAAGLDARPWRLSLPETLRWVDVDLPEILEYKLEHLAGERTNCRYEAIKGDLRDADVLRDVLGRVGQMGQRVLVVSEGLLIYLEESDVARLATALAAQPSFRWWAHDLASPRLLKYMSRSWQKSLQKGNAPFRFAPTEGAKFFETFGWRESEFHSAGEDAKRLGREIPFAWFWRGIARVFFRRRREEYRRMAGVVVHERA